MTIQLKDVEQAILIDNLNARAILLNYAAAGERNIYCLTRSGQLKWRVAAPDRLPGYDWNYFVGIELRDEVLYGYSVNGILFIIDQQTGQLLSKTFIK